MQRNRYSSSWSVRAAAGTVLSLSSLGAAYAAPCRDIATVQESALSAENNRMGGHINRHIWGATPPAGHGQKDGTMFTSVEEYTGFWRNYSDPKVYKGTPVNCSGDKARQRVTVQSVLNKPVIGAFSCTSELPNGVCDAKTRKQYPNVQIDFKLVNGVWILETVYPADTN